ncbi:MAG: acyltransferase family protein [Methanoregula sp.]|nr:acyltransferase family protein [Methanoregula sp.]
MTVAEAADKKSGPRLLYIDSIRILLICLVIATHCSITYGGPGAWYFTDPGNGSTTPFILFVIDSLNQSFFMGFFVLVSAYFVVGSLQRKGRDRFTRDRLVRLGIPLLVWVLLINPLILLIILNGTGTLPMPPATFLNPLTGAGLGPMWFVFFLLVATFVYLLWTGLFRTEPHVKVKSHPFPGFASIVALGLLLGIVTAVVRIFLPIGSMWLFGFQLPFFPQYIAAFIIGIYAAQNNWFDDIPSRVGKTCAIAALFLIAVQPVFIHLITNSSSGPALFIGGLQWQAVFYAFWEQMAGVMIITGMLWLFSQWFNRQGPVARAMAGDSYTVYIIHPVILILLAIALAGFALPQLTKFAVVLPLAICFSFLLAHLIRAIPGVKSVL